MISFKRLHRRLRKLKLDYSRHVEKSLPFVGLLLTVLHLTDYYESYVFGYVSSMWWELARIGIIFLVVLSTRLLHLSSSWFYRNALFWMLLFFYGTLWLPDENYFLTLPWMIIMGVFSFWFLEGKSADKWAWCHFVLFGIVTFLSWMDVVHTLYNTRLLFQVWGALGITIYMMQTVRGGRISYENELARLIEENQMLYDETRHRTKNNLQLIISLIERERLGSNSKSVEQLLTRLTYRVRAFDAILASRASDDEHMVDIPQTLRRIADSYEQDIHCNIELELMPLKMSHKHANYLALICNEALSNIKKHACPGGATHVMVRLVPRDTERSWKLEIKDNGSTRNITLTEKTGMNLIASMARALPDGQFVLEADNGVLVRILFDNPPRRTNKH